jgi:hypothetical protein
MASVVFSDDELLEFDRICAELDPGAEELITAHIGRLQKNDRQRVLDYFRRVLRAELILGIIARAGGDAAVVQGAAAPEAPVERIEQDFKRRYNRTEGYTHRLSYWQYDFGTFRNEELQINETLVGLGKSAKTALLVAFHTLILDTAYERMFGYVDKP